MNLNEDRSNDRTIRRRRRKRRRRKLQMRRRKQRKLKNLKGLLLLMMRSLRLTLKMKSLISILRTERIGCKLKETLE
jgi:hypothetical protein